MFAVAIIFITIFVMATIGTVRANMQYKKATRSVTRYQQWATPTTYYHYHSNTRDEYVAMRGDAGLIDPTTLVAAILSLCVGTMFAYAMAYVCHAVCRTMRTVYTRMVSRGAVHGDRGAITLRRGTPTEYYQVQYARNGEWVDLPTGTYALHQYAEARAHARELGQLVSFAVRTVEVHQF